MASDENDTSVTGMAARGFNAVNLYAPIGTPRKCTKHLYNLNMKIQAYRL